MIRKTQDCGLEFYEQLLPKWDLEGMGRLRRKFGVPILADEAVNSVRDARINGKLACLILNAQTLPVRMGQFLGRMEGFLTDIQSGLNRDFDLSGVVERVRALAPLCSALEEKLSGMDMAENDQILKQTAREAMPEIIYTDFSRILPY